MKRCKKCGEEYKFNVCPKCGSLEYEVVYTIGRVNPYLNSRSLVE